LAHTEGTGAERSQSGGVRDDGTPKMRNEANREARRAKATGGCETKPIRRGGGHGKNAWATGAKRSQSHSRTVRQSGNPLCFQYRTGVEQFERMCMNRLAEIVVTDGRNSSDVADFEAVAVNVWNRGVIGNADRHPSLQDALQLLPASFQGLGIRPDARDRAARHVARRFAANWCQGGR
jgi:hypothetical protein